MAYIIVGVIINFYIFGLLIFAIWDVKKNWKLPKAEKQKNGKKYFIACLVLALLFQYEPYAKRIDYENGMKKAKNILNQTMVLIGESPGILECKKRLDSGEFTHVTAYVNCQEPFILEAYKEAGVTHSDSLQSISNMWLKMATMTDKGETNTTGELGKEMLEIIRRDVSYY